MRPSRRRVLAGDGGLLYFGWCDLTFGEVDVKGGGGGEDVARASER